MCTIQNIKLKDVYLRKNIILFDELQIDIYQLQYVSCNK